MLSSGRKLSSIGEMLTIRFAASEPPGERHSSDFDSLVVSFQDAGTVHDMPCWSHFAVLPPANAAVCAAVGFACSTSPPLLDPVAVFRVAPEFVDDLSLLVRLQSESAKPSRSSTGICFIGTLTSRRLKEQSASMRKQVSSQPACRFVGADLCVRPGWVASKRADTQVRPYNYNYRPIGLAAFACYPTTSLQNHPLCNS